MSWLTNQDRELLEAAIIHTPCCMLFSKPSGDILWANNAFVKWSGYTLFELQSMTWMELTVTDENLRADIAEAQEMAKNDGYSIFYSVMKQYIPKHGQPCWGLLHVMRYPPLGDLTCCVCVWDPIKESFTESFNLIRDTANKGNKAMQDMTNALNDLKKAVIPEETPLSQKAVLILMRLIATYPKRSMAIALFFFVLFLGNLAVDTIQKYKSIITIQQPSP